MEPWLGVLHLVRQDTETQEDFEGIAAVFCADRQGYEAAVKAVVEAQGYQLLWAEECHPAGQWIARHPKDRSAAGLARAVHSGHRIEVGTLKAVGKEGEEPEEEQPYLIIEEIEGVEPLDLQFGVHPRKSVPDSLYEPLFGQPEPTEAELEQYGAVEAVPPMRTYAILDAAKMPYLLTGHLERSELRYQCLFQGDTAEELKEHAPYLVELEDHNDFTQRLFTGPEGVNGLWEKELGIYIRSHAEFDEMRKHLRKFTRMKDAEGAWYYFAFWEPSMTYYAAKLVTELPFLLEHGNLYSTLMEKGYFISINGGKAAKIGTNRPSQDFSFVLDKDFFSFLYPVARSGIDHQKIDLEPIYKGISKLWASGIREKEEIEAYARIRKSNGLTLILDKVINGKSATSSAQSAAVNYLSRLV